LHRFLIIQTILKGLIFFITTFFLSSTITLVVEIQLGNVKSIRGDLGQGKGRFRPVPLVVPDATREWCDIKKIKINKLLKLLK